MKFLKDIFSQKIPSLGELGIFGISYDEDQDEMSFCYYLMRSFGNVLIHKTPNLSQFYNSFKNRGGIYKQIDFAPHFTTMNTEIFNVFGAALVTDHDYFDKKYPTEQFGVDFSDAHIKPLQIKNKTCLAVYLKEKWLLFFHFDFNDKTEFSKNDLEQIEKYKISYLFFHRIYQSSRCYFSIQEFKEFVK